MSVDVLGTTVTVRKVRTTSRVWAPVYLLAGAGLIWLGMTQEAVRHVGSIYLGVAFGLGVAGMGLSFLLPEREILRFDIASQQLHQDSFRWLRGIQRNTVPFAEVSSVGTDIFKDPRNGLVWGVQGVIRLRNGQRISAGSADDATTIGSLAGWVVDHQIILAEEPPESAPPA